MIRKATLATLYDGSFTFFKYGTVSVCLMKLLDWNIFLLVLFSIGICVTFWNMIESSSISRKNSNHTHISNDKSNGGKDGISTAAAAAAYPCNNGKKDDSSSKEMHVDLLTGHMLPPDVQVHLYSYLHPRTLTTLSCVNVSLRERIDGVRTRTDDNGSSSNNSNNNSNDCCISNLLWKGLWYRDYGWVMTDWDVGCIALNRSIHNISDDITSDENEEITKAEIVLAQLIQNLSKTSMSSMKELYFTFGLSYLNYTLAGQNTLQKSLLGIHGHIFDFTNFADYHPGLLDDVLFKCGRDATPYFEDIRHSKVARIIAMKLCVVVDRGCCDDEIDSGILMRRSHKRVPLLLLEEGIAGNGGFGLYRPPRDDITTSWAIEDSNSRPPRFDARESALGLDRILPMTVTKPRRANTLFSVRAIFDKELVEVEAHQQEEHKKKYGRSTTLRVYYDPFRREWKGWYTDCHSLQPVYCDFDT